MYGEDSEPVCVAVGVKPVMVGGATFTVKVPADVTEPPAVVTVKALTPVASDGMVAVMVVEVAVKARLRPFQITLDVVDRLVPVRVTVEPATPEVGDTPVG